MRTVVLLSAIGVMVTQAQQPAGGTLLPNSHLGVLRGCLAAVGMDPTHPNTAENLLAVYINWGTALSQSGKSEDAIEVLRFGKLFRPDSRRLREALGSAWMDHIDATLKGGKDAEAMAQVKQAAKDLPESPEFKNAADSFERFGWKVHEEKGAEAALPVAARALKLVDDKGAAQIRDWRSGIYRRWSQELLDKKDVDGSFKVMVQAFSADRTSRNIHEGIGYHLQNALKIAAEKGEIPALTAHFQQATKAFPGVEEVPDVAEAYVRRGCRSLCDAGKYAEAMKHLEQYAALLPKAEQKTDAGASVYDAWGRALAEEKKWEAALDRYGEGLKLYPNHPRLVNNAAVIVDRWVDTPFQEKKWDEAIRIYKIGLKQLPDHPGLKYNLKICEDRRGRK